MKTKSTYTAILVAAILGSLSFQAVATDAIEVSGFGESKLANITPVKKQAGECVSFEASFSEPLNKSPTAMLDITRHFTNMWNSLLDVTKISDTKYRFALTASTAAGCPSIEEESRLTVYTYGGRESDSLQSVPDEMTFKADKKAVLKKE